MADTDFSFSEEDVIAYLKARPDILEKLSKEDEKTNSVNNAGATIVDLTGTIAAKARTEARRLAARNQSLMDAAASNMLHWQELHHATLGFLACTNLTGFAHMVDEELPIIFSLAGARLIMPAETALDNAEELGFLVLPAAEINQILAAQSIYLGPAEKTGPVLFSTPAASMAAIALPDQLPAPICGSALILAGRTEESFQPGHGKTLLTNLAEIIGVCLLARLEAR